jgi:signal transduction histidine kinase
LFNVVKHARARHVRVELASSPQETRLRIADDGIGLPASRKQRSPSAGRGYGLVFMRERAEALGGALVLRRRARRGTVVEATIPRATGEEQ